MISKANGKNGVSRQTVIASAKWLGNIILVVLGTAALTGLLMWHRIGLLEQRMESHQEVSDQRFTMHVASSLEAERIQDARITAFEKGE